jgi:ATP-dependent RNA helicase DeaD
MLLAAIERVGFEKPTDIQRELIPPALAGRDCLGQARTGTGKTAAFTLPLLQRVQPRCGIQALVLVPTRELAAQVGEQVRLLSPAEPPQTLVVYGGTGIGANLRELKRGVDIVVGTPGRIST